MLAMPATTFAQPTGRNILFIAVDDLRTWVGYTGDYPGTIHTPNIDALAAVSTRYLAAYTPVPQCVGSRTSVLLGQSAATHGIDRSHFESLGDYNALFNNPFTITLPEVLSQNGYYTAVTGKVFHTPFPDRWDESGPATIIADLGGLLDPGPDNTYINPEVLGEFEEHPDQTVATWASDFITNYIGGGTGAQPFFLAVGFYQPHLPWRVHQAYYDLYPLGGVVTVAPVAGELDDEPTTAVDYAAMPLLFGSIPQYDAVELAGKQAEYTQAYLATISHTDAMVGQLLAALAASPYASNTDIIFWSDHGWHLGEKRHWRKNTFWQPAVRVPLLVSSPGNVNYPVSDVTDSVSLVDLAATVVDLAGLPPHGTFEGAPLYDAANRSPAQIHLRGGRATISGDFKNVDYDLSSPGLNHLARYDLVNDPNELVNLTPPGGC